MLVCSLGVPHRDHQPTKLCQGMYRPPPLRDVESSHIATNKSAKEGSALFIYLSTYRVSCHGWQDGVVHGPGLATVLLVAIKGNRIKWIIPADCFAFGGKDNGDDNCDSLLVRGPPVVWPTWSKWRLVKGGRVGEEEEEQQNVWPTTVCIPEPRWVVTGHCLAGIASSPFHPTAKEIAKERTTTECRWVSARGEANNGDALRETWVAAGQCLSSSSSGDWATS